MGLSPDSGSGKFVRVRQGNLTPKQKVTGAAVSSAMFVTRVLSESGRQCGVNCGSPLKGVCPPSSLVLVTKSQGPA